MIRLIGILTGSAIAVGLLIVTLGIPKFSEPVEGGFPVAVAAKAPPTGTDAGGGLPVAVAAKAPPTGSDEVESKAPPTEAAVGGGLPATEPVAEPVGGGLPATEPELTDEQLVEQIFAPQADPILEEHWYAFWSPFRSEIAANGFVSRLQQTTGMDYRIVKLKPGVYEVAFAYTDQDDIDQKLERISAATGLDMSGG